MVATLPAGSPEWLALLSVSYLGSIWLQLVQTERRCRVYQLSVSYIGSIQFATTLFRIADKCAVVDDARRTDYPA